MGTWVKETDQAIYLMEGNGYIDSVVKQPSPTNPEEQIANIAPLKSWFARTDSPRGMTVAIGTGAPEPQPINPNSDGKLEHNGQLKVVHDTYFKLSPKSANELTNVEKVFVRKDAIHDIKSYKDVGNYHWLVELEKPPAGSGTTTWYVFMPHIRLLTDAVLTITYDTFFKLEPKLSSALPPTAKIWVKQNTQFNVESFLPAEGDHTQIELADTTLGASNGTLWYVYNLHFKADDHGSHPAPEHPGMQIRALRDTYLTLSPVPPSELPSQQKVLFRQGAVFNIQFYNKVSRTHWKIELVKPGLGDERGTSWYINTAETQLVSDTNLTALRDTTFKLEPKPASDLPASSKVFVRQGTSFQLVSHLPAPGNHSRVELANASFGSNPERTWYTYNPHIRITGQRQFLEVVSNTVLKSSPVSSTALTEEQKVSIPENTIFELSSYQQPKNNHIKVALKGAFLGPYNRNTWYCYVPHIYIVGTEIGNRPNDSNNSHDPGDPDDRGIPLQFPGFTDTYYSNDPIFLTTQYGEKGHFTWGEALHVDVQTGNYRRPASADVIYSIQRIARVLEDIRKRYGGIPIQINSWYRDPTTNTAVGGASRSRHMAGDAVDFVVPGKHPYDVYADLDGWWGNRGGLASSKTFTHIDVRGYKARWDYDAQPLEDMRQAWSLAAQDTEPSWGTWVKETDIALYLMRSNGWIARIMKSPSTANPQEKVLDITTMADWFSMPNAPTAMTLSLGTGAAEPAPWDDGPSTGHTGEINASGLEILKHFEGLRTTAYKDPVGIWTIGYGHTSMAGPPRVYEGMTITAAEAETILKQDLDVFERGVADALTVTTSNDQFSAMVSFAFNVGLSALRSSTLLKKHNARDVAGAADEFLRWVYANGEVLPGLERRRKAERALYLSQDYDPFMRATVTEERPRVSRTAVVTTGVAAIAGLAFAIYNRFVTPPTIPEPIIPADVNPSPQPSASPMDGNPPPDLPSSPDDVSQPVG